MLKLNIAAIFKCIALLLSATAGASAAEIEVVPPSAVGKIPLIMVIGDIDREDGEDFIRKASNLDNALVAFHSGGGDLVSGITIGETIHQKKFKTVVTKGSMCASACAFAWLGGSERFMQPGARIGFHAAYNATTGRETGVGNAVLGAYLSRIGLSYGAIIYITKAAPSEMTWLNPRDAAQRGIAISGRPQNAEPEKQPEPKRQASPDVPTGSATTTDWTYNGSTLSLVADGAERRIFYRLPRAGLTEVGVRSGTLYFEGQQAGRTYRGRAHVFSKVCGAISYPVAGEVSEDNRTISFGGQAPLVDERCRVVSLQAVTTELTTLIPLPQTPAPAASGATLIDGAAPTVPTGSFNPRWGRFQ